jgi:hypothetical protein
VRLLTVLLSEVWRGPDPRQVQFGVAPPRAIDTLEIRGEQQWCGGPIRRALGVRPIVRRHAKSARLHGPLSADQVP